MPLLLALWSVKQKIKLLNLYYLLTAQTELPVIYLTKRIITIITRIKPTPP